MLVSIKTKVLNTFARAIMVIIDDKETIVKSFLLISCGCFVTDLQMKKLKRTNNHFSVSFRFSNRTLKDRFNTNKNTS